MFVIERNFGTERKIIGMLIRAGKGVHRGYFAALPFSLM